MLSYTVSAVLYRPGLGFPEVDPSRTRRVCPPPAGSRQVVTVWLPLSRYSVTVCRYRRCRRPLSAIRCPPSAVYRSPSAVRCPLSIFHRPPSVVHCPVSVVSRPPSTVHRPPSTVHRAPPTLPTIHHPPSTIHHPPSPSPAALVVYAVDLLTTSRRCCGASRVCPTERARAVLKNRQFTATIGTSKAAVSFYEKLGIIWFPSAQRCELGLSGLVCRAKRIVRTVDTL